MGLFGQNYENAGAGIAKNAPKKKGFFRFMEIFGRKFWKMIGLNLLYSVFFLPLFAAVVLFVMRYNGNVPSGAPTVLMIAALAGLFVVLFGPATAGHTKVLRAYVLEKPVFIVHDFFSTFKSEFKYSFVVGLIDCLVAACIAASLYIYPIMIKQYDSKIIYVFFALALSVGIVVLMMNFYTFLMIIATNLKLKQILKNSLALAIIALKKNLITLAVVTVFVFAFAGVIIFADISIAVIAMSVLPFIPASWLGLVICFNSYPIIQKYIINPYYEQRGEINPELLGDLDEPQDPEETLFEDMGGREKPVVSKKTAKSKSGGANGRNSNHKGKIIS